MLIELRPLFADCPSREIATNQTLFRSGEAVRHLFFVEQGTLVLERYLKTGTVTCLQRAQAGDVLAEASVYAQRYHCDARALETSRVRTLTLTQFRKALAARSDLSEAWSRHLARAVHATRFLSEIRGMRTVAERLDAWLSEHEALPKRGHWKALAAELAVSHEALYRELARRDLSD